MSFESRGGGNGGGTTQAYWSFALHNGVPVIARGSIVSVLNGSTLTRLGNVFASLVLDVHVYNGQLYAASEGVYRWTGLTWERLGTLPNVEVLTTFQGQLHAAGYFGTVNGVVYNGVARWDGSAWQPLGQGLSDDVGAFPGSSVVTNSNVLGSGIDDMIEFQGELVVTGRFARAGSVAAANIARWDGSTWRALPAPGAQIDAPVRASVIHQGRLIIGGGFINAGGSVVNGIAQRVNGAWAPMGNGFQGAVASLASDETNLIAGGLVQLPDGTVKGRVSRWDGSQWQRLGASESAASFDNVIDRVLLLGGRPIAVGAFSTVGGVVFAGLAQWTGSTWTSVGSRIFLRPAAAEVFGGELFIAVNRTTSDTPVQIWNGTEGRPGNSGLPTNGRFIQCFGIAGGTLYAGTTETTASPLFRWNGTGWDRVPGLSFGAGSTGVTAIGERAGRLVVYLNGTLYELLDDGTWNIITGQLLPTVYTIREHAEGFSLGLGLPSRAQRPVAYWATLDQADGVTIPLRHNPKSAVLFGANTAAGQPIFADGLSNTYRTGTAAAPTTQIYTFTYTRNGVPLGTAEPTTSGVYRVTNIGPCGGQTSDEYLIKLIRVTRGFTGVDPYCRLDYNNDSFISLDDLGDFVTDFFSSPALGARDQPWSGAEGVGYCVPCPDNPFPYDFGYRVGFTPDDSPQCSPPTLDNLQDFITAYYAGC